MNVHAMAVLEFETLVKELVGFCLSQRQAQAEYSGLLEGRIWYRNSLELSDLHAVASFYQLALESAVNVPHEAWQNLDATWEAINREGYVATIEELAALLCNMRAVEAFIQFTRQNVADLDPNLVPATIQSALGRLPAFPGIANEIEACIERHGELKVDRIPELRNARQAIASRQGELRQYAASYVRDNGLMLSGDFATIRDGRTVLPVKSGYKGRIEGFVHHASASGSTLFMEPWELVEKNNAVSQAEHEYQAEVYKVLARLSRSAARQGVECAQFEACADQLVRGFARARQARSRNGLFAVTEGPVKLKQARHPLLGRKAVPIDMEIPAGKDLLILSGPNTGGKTVSMKTLGLAVLMRQTAMGILAAEGSTLPFFDGLLADIGDEQSIANDLSTFSGHLSRIKECMTAAHAGTLVLIDELGSGTDPDEGAALAVAIGEALLASGCTSLVTSHYAALKALGWTEKRALNACMDYLPAEGRPSYRLVPGMPGASHAIDTARRIGIPSEIVQRAQNIVNAKGDPAFDLVQRLAVEHRELTDLRKELDQQQLQFQAKFDQLDLQQTELNRERQALRVSQLSEHSQFMAQSRSQVEAVLRQLREQVARNQSKAIHDAEAAAARDVLKTLSSALEERIDAEEAAVPMGDQGFKPGDRVRLINSHGEGFVRSLGKKGNVLVELGGKRLHVRADNLQLLAPKVLSTKAQVSYELAEKSQAEICIDLRGMRLQEALDTLARQLDAALVQNLGFFAIIHGMGEGVLQKGIREFLAKANGVRSFEFARPEDGGFGKTLVHLG